MNGRISRVVQVSTMDNRGGAARDAWRLHKGYLQRGLWSHMVVGRKFSNDSSVLVMPNDEAKPAWTRVLIKIIRRFEMANHRVRSAWRLGQILQWSAEPRRLWDIWRGIEDFHHPGTWRLLELFPESPDIIHCHNLHGYYFDLRTLPWLSRQVPVVLTLHDAWLLSGHCAHSFSCDRWQTVCGCCPDLTIYPAIRRDATTYNWRRKQQIFANSRFYVTAPSRWLMQRVEQSMLAPAAVEARVIPYGIDLSVFHPGDREAVRTVLDIPQSAKVLLFAADGIRQNIYKDYKTMRTALALVAKSMNRENVLLIALGEDAPAERIGQAEVHFVPYEQDPMVVARYYQAANVYVHAARVDTFPNTVLEAMACGTPVVATAVGGIPEQIKDGITGFLVNPGDARDMATRIEQILSDDNFYKRMCVQAVEDANRRFDVNREVANYLDWYLTILESWRSNKMWAEQ